MKGQWFTWLRRIALRCGMEGGAVQDQRHQHKTHCQTRCNKRPALPQGRATAGCQQSSDSRKKDTTAGRHRECGVRLAHFFDGRQRCGVGQAVATDLHGQIIAAVLAFAPHLTGKPPDGRMVEQQSLDDDLQEIDQVIVAADMGQFVGEDCFELCRRKTREDGCGNKDYRTQPSQYERSFDEDRLHQTHRAAQVHSTHQTGKQLMSGRVGRVSSNDFNRCAAIQPPRCHRLRLNTPNIHVPTRQGNAGSSFAARAAI